MSLRDGFIRRAAPTCLLFAMLGTGCIVLPLGGYKPFKGKETGFIEVGVTTKDEVTDGLGSPRFVFLPEKGSMLVYEGRGISKWFFAWAGDYAGGAETLRTSYWFVLRIYLDDEDTVTRTDLTRVRSSKFFNSKDCPAVDLCYDRGHWFFLASRGMQRRTLESAVPDDLCAVCILSETKLFVTIDEEPGIMPLNDLDFVHRWLEPGVHRFRRHQTEFELDCEGGRRYFLRVASDGGMQLVDSDVGSAETSARRLLLAAQDS